DERLLPASVPGRKSRESRNFDARLTFAQGPVRAVTPTKIRRLHPCDPPLPGRGPAPTLAASGDFGNRRCAGEEGGRMPSSDRSAGVAAASHVQSTDVSD